MKERCNVDLTESLNRSLREIENLNVLIQCLATGSVKYLFVE